MKRLKQRARYTLYCLILSLFSCSISLGTKTPYATSDITFNVYSRDSQLVTLVHSVLMLTLFVVGGARSARYRPHGYKPPPTRKMSPAIGGPVRKTSLDSLRTNGE